MDALPSNKRIELSNDILGRIKSASEYIVGVRNPNGPINKALVKREIKLRTERALRYANR